MHSVSKLIFGAALAVGLSAPAVAEISGEFITSGKTASDGAWPWQVRLLDSFDVNTGFCGGSLITEQWVLTAAHCMVTDEGVAESVVVGYGSNYQSKLSMIGSEKIFVHPDYLEGYAADVALIKLAEPIPNAAWIEIATEEVESQADHARIDAGRHRLGRLVGLHRVRGGGVAAATAARWPRRARSSPVASFSRPSSCARSRSS